MADYWKFVSIVTALVSTIAIAASANAAASPRDITALGDASYLYIATVRKDGNQSTAAPVWFIAKPDGEILVDTNTDSWKAKRIGRGSPVLVWIGSRTGPAFIGKAEFILASWQPGASLLKPWTWFAMRTDRKSVV